MSEKERVRIDALLKRGEYPVIVDLLKMGQDINNAMSFLQKLKCNVDKAVAEHTELKIERRIIEERRVTCDT